MAPRRFLAFGVSAAISVLASQLALAEGVKKQGVDKPRPGAGAPERGSASRGASGLEPASAAETPEDAEARQLRDEDERKATESKEKMKKRPGFREEVPAPRA